MNSILFWLHPGIGVKRWLLLAAGGGLGAVVGLLTLIGPDLVRAIPDLFPTGRGAYATGGLLLIGGLAAVGYGTSRAARSIKDGFGHSSERRRRRGEILSERRRRWGPKVVAIGGGTGLSVLLRGLKDYTANITAIVTVMDDGGSSGRLRRELNMLPPGDIRNCLIALAEDESRMARLFQHRFQNGNGSLHGHSLGNLVIAGLHDMTGGFDRAIEELGLILNIRGRVVPPTIEDVELVAEMEDGDLVAGECAMSRDPRRIKQMKLSRPSVPAYPKALEAIQRAGLMSIGPGSLFTSIIPNLLVDDMAAEIECSRARKFYIMNLMTQPGETDGFTAADHVRVLGEYINTNVLDYVILNSEPVPPDILEAYRQEGAEPVVDDLGETVGRARVLRSPLLQISEMDGKRTVKHSPRNLARAVFGAQARGKHQRAWPLGARMRSVRDDRAKGEEL